MASPHSSELGCHIFQYETFFVVSWNGINMRFRSYFNGVEMKGEEVVLFFSCSFFIRWSLQPFSFLLLFLFFFLAQRRAVGRDSR